MWNCFCGFLKGGWTTIKFWKSQPTKSWGHPLGLFESKKLRTLCNRTWSSSTLSSEAWCKKMRILVIKINSLLMLLVIEIISYQCHLFMVIGCWRAVVNLRTASLRRLRLREAMTCWDELGWSKSELRGMIHGPWKIIRKITWLVVWNHGILWLSIYWEE